MATTVLKTRKLNFSKKKRLSSEEEAFRDACGDGNLEEASRHLDKIDIDFCLEHSWTVLMMNLHDLNVATWLLERGADPNYITSDGFTVLYSASRATHREPLIRLLVKHGMRMQLWVVKEEPLNAIRTFGGTEFVVEMFRAGIEIQTSNFSPQKYVIPPIMDNMESLFMNNYKFSETVKTLLLCAHEKDPNSPFHKGNMPRDMFKLFYRECVMVWRRHEWVKIVGK